MVDPAPVLAQVQADAIRITLLDPNGVPHPGSASLYVTDALTKVTLKPVYKAGTDINEVNASGALCVDYMGPPTYRRLDVTVEVCTPDPYLSFLLGQGDIIDPGVSGAPDGYSAPPVGQMPRGLKSVEFWTKRVEGGDVDADWPYAWWVLPGTRDWHQTDFSAENKSMPLTFEGQGNENQNWFDGPTNDWPAASDRTHQWVPAKSLPALTPHLAPVAAS